MNVTLLKGKIHRAVVTHADLHYEGSVTIDDVLMKRARILPNQCVHVWNVTRGTRVVTYAISGPANSGIICLNGAAAHRFDPGNLVIIAAFAEMSEAEARQYTPAVVRVNSKNVPLEDDSQEVPGRRLATGSDDAWGRHG